MADCEVFDINTKECKTIAPLNFHCSRHCSILYGESIFKFGGLCQSAKPTKH